MQVIITSPSLDPAQNVSGISSVTQFIIGNNCEHEYIHFELGRKDNEASGWQRIPAIYRRLKDWKRTLKQHPEAIIHYNFPLSTPSILRDPLFMFIARQKKRRMAIHVHGGVFLASTSTPWVLERIMKWVFTGNEPIIVLSDKEKESLGNRFHCKKVIVLPNCIDLSEAEQFQREISSSTLEIGYLGRIAESKGMKELLEACQELKRQQIPFCLHLAGKEEIENQFLPVFREILGDNFVYEGVVSKEKKTAFLKKIDCFILPSYFEGLPMSLLEAMSFGCVPVTTMVGSIRSVVEPNSNGIAITPHSSSDIVEEVIKLQKDRTLLQTLSVKAKNTIFKQFSPPKYIATLNDIYKQL